jgi:hypothetical protein
MTEATNRHNKTMENRIKGLSITLKNMIMERFHVFQLTQVSSLIESLRIVTHYSPYT